MKKVVTSWITANVCPALLDQTSRRLLQFHHATDSLRPGLNADYLTHFQPVEGLNRYSFSVRSIELSITDVIDMTILKALGNRIDSEMSFHLAETATRGLRTKF